MPIHPVNIVYAILALGLLIFIHELGHFIAAKRMGMPVETFSIGFGPRLVGFKWRETDVRLSALPLGGYVSLAGFNPGDPGADDPHGFLQQPFGKKMLFYAGGVLANFIVAFGLFTLVGIDQARVTKFREWNGAIVSPGSPAERGGLRMGDEILRIGDLGAPEASSWRSVVVPYVQAHPGQAIPFVVVRNGKEAVLQLTPIGKVGAAKLGFALDRFREPLERRSLRLGDVGAGVQYSTSRIRYLTAMIGQFLKRAVTFDVNRSEVSGPAGMVGEMAKALSRGWLELLYFCGAISLQLAIMNTLPVPMLDGWYMFTLLIEKVRRREFDPVFKERMLRAGFVGLVGLMFVVVMLDLFNLRR